MATGTAPSSLMLTHAASSVHPQDLSPSLRCFNPKPLFRTFSLHPLVLRSRGRSPSKLIDANLQREAKSRSYHVVVAALAAEVEVADGVEQKEEAESGDGSITSTITAAKPKKGKAALSLKRDRARLIYTFISISGGRLRMSPAVVSGAAIVAGVDLVANVAALGGAAYESLPHVVTSGRDARVLAWEYVRLVSAISTVARLAQPPSSNFKGELNMETMAYDLMRLVISDAPRFSGQIQHLSLCDFSDKSDLNTTLVAEFSTPFCKASVCKLPEKFQNVVVKILIYAFCVFEHERPACKALSVYDYEDDVRPSFISGDRYKEEFESAYEAALVTAKSSGLPRLAIAWSTISTGSTNPFSWRNFVEEIYQGMRRLDDNRKSTFGDDPSQYYHSRD